MGFGFQLDFDTGTTTGGIEIVIYIDETVCGDNDYKIVIYNYSGAEISVSDMSNISNLLLSELTMSYAEIGTWEQDAVLFLLKTIMEGVGMSGGVFVIDGNDDFKSADSYSGAFETVSLSAQIKNTTHAIYYSYSPTCEAYGYKVGITTSVKKIWPFMLDATYSRTEYSSPHTLLEGAFPW